jgi:hypothetical protein
MDRLIAAEVADMQKLMIAVEQFPHFDQIALPNRGGDWFSFG